MNITRALKSRWLLYARRPPSPRAADTAAEAKVVVKEVAAAVVKEAVTEAAAPGGETMEAPVGATVEATEAAGPKIEAV